MELYLIRHGQSVNNANGEDLSKRHRDAPLTEIGHEQAQRVAQHLAGNDYPEMAFSRYPQQGYRVNYGLTRLYCSAMHRALQTAQPIAAALGLQPEVWVDIHEQGGIYLDETNGRRGYPGLTRSEISTQFGGYVLPEDVTDNGWWNRDYETPSVFEARALRVAARLREWAQTHAQERVGMVSHGEFIDALIKALLNQLPGYGVYYHHYNTAITRIDFRDGDTVLLYVNRVAHLPTTLITA